MGAPPQSLGGVVDAEVQAHLQGKHDRDHAKHCESFIIGHRETDCMELQHTRHEDRHRIQQSGLDRVRQEAPIEAPRLRYKVSYRTYRQHESHGDHDGDDDIREEAEDEGSWGELRKERAIEGRACRRRSVGVYQSDP